MGVKVEAGKRLPAFAVWHAHQLQPRDLMFGSFMLLTFCLYLFKTVPAACSIGPEPIPAAADTVSNTGQQQQQQWPLAWRFFCRSPLAPVTWPLTLKRHHPPSGVDGTLGSFTNPAAPHLLSQDTSNAHQTADAHASPTAANARLQEQPEEATQRGIPTKGSWRQQAASSVKGSLRALAAKLLNKAAALTLAGLQVRKARGSCKASPVLALGVHAARHSVVQRSNVTYKAPLRTQAHRVPYRWRWNYYYWLACASVA
jgi:hypothetical protein